jgi:hypothetical protein
MHIQMAFKRFIKCYGLCIKVNFFYIAISLQNHYIKLITLTIRKGTRT